MSRLAPILIVDDDRDEIDVVFWALRRAGLEGRVEVARDGQQALERLGLETSSGEGPLRPCAVFLDLKMPRVDGWEVLRRLRGALPTENLPVVVVSSSDHPDDIRRSYALGANSFLVKRFDPRGPGTYLAEAVRYWLEHNRPPPGAREGGRERCTVSPS